MLSRLPETLLLDTLLAEYAGYQRGKLRVHLYQERRLLPRRWTSRASNWERSFDEFSGLVHLPHVSKFASLHVTKTVYYRADHPEYGFIRVYSFVMLPNLPSGQQFRSEALVRY